MSRYEQPAYTSKAEAEQLFASEDAETVVRALLGAALEERDRSWVERWCLRLIESDDAQVRRAAVQSAGHLARIHRALDPRLVAAIEALAKDRALGGAASDALDDLRMFLRPR